MPSEAVQYNYYRTILEKAGNKHCVIRLMDIGGDKVPQFFDMPLEFNPFMGWRAIRIFLERKDLFETQVAAIMRAGEGYDYSTGPMVTTLQEWPGPAIINRLLTRWESGCHYVRLFKSSQY